MNFIQRDLDTMKNPKKLNLLIATMMKKYHLSLLEFLFQMILSSKNFSQKMEIHPISIYWLLKGRNMRKRTGDAFPRKSVILKTFYGDGASVTRSSLAQTN